MNIYLLKHIDCFQLYDRFEPAVTYSSSIQPLCLPEPTDKLSAQSTCYATGWGSLNAAGSRFPAKLQQVALPFQAASRCRSWLGSRFKQSSMICSGYSQGGRDTCGVGHEFMVFPYVFLYIFCTCCNRVSYIIH